MAGNKTKCTAADGMTQVFGFGVGTPLMVRAVDFNAMVAQRDLLLEALLAEQEWRAREDSGEIDPEWDYEHMVGDKRRTAIAKATGPA